MKCSYCTEDAIEGGEAPPGTGGTKHLLACAKHAHRIKSLGFIPKPVSEIRVMLKREEKETKK